ncbi:glycosyltransferase [Deinococcus sp.]|uniref:glycosyltransferase n=1 Tax=Deinococcus sp. TaxID=47478 RepID=UPI0025C0A954|nr:glycosyltransferase [Deinococcus sp.]
MQRRDDGPPFADRLINGLTLGFFAVKLGTLLVNAFTFPRLKAATDPARPSRASILIPARDEAHNLRETLPPLLAQGALEVIVLDDSSTDKTVEVARELGARVISGQPLAAGWVGKTWACQQLGQAAHGELLIFTDADVHWHPGALRAVVAELERTQAGLLSIFPRQDNRTLGERLLTPQVDTTILSLFPAPLLRLPYAAAAANGQVMAFRRATYEKLGGHACVQAELLEDVTFARRVKGAGERLSLALGREFIGVRMYQSYPQSVRGLARSALPLHGGRRELLVVNTVLQAVFYTLPLLRRQRGLVALGLLESLAVRWLTGRNRTSELAEVGMTPLQPLFYVPVVWTAIRKRTRWKGREYEV